MLTESSSKSLEELSILQAERLRTLLRELLEHSPFYQAKLRSLRISPESLSLSDLPSIPLTEKAELARDQEKHPPYGSNLTRPLSEYVRIHRTSGTSGTPLRVLDTRAGWATFIDCWEGVLRTVGVNSTDHVFVAFSFGPFIGFWGAFEAAQRLGALTVSGGAQTTRQRLQAMIEENTTVLICTPTYALHLAEVAEREEYDLVSSTVKKLVLAGEPGASVPNVYSKLRRAWNAEIYDHAGASELGAWGFPDTSKSAAFGTMCINSEHFIAEVIDPDSDAPTEMLDGVLEGELVLTSLTRTGTSLLRYRTGDLVRLLPPSASHPFPRLLGGVLGRVDDMFVVRGVNIFPSAVENVVLGTPGVAEFRGTVLRTDGLAELSLEVEPTSDFSDSDAFAGLLSSVRQRLRDDLSLRVTVEAATEALPRYELKARRFQFRTVDSQPT